jgi:hypothetical protein
MLLWDEGGDAQGGGSNPPTDGDQGRPDATDGDDGEPSTGELATAVPSER